MTKFFSVLASLVAATSVTLAMAPEAQAETRSYSHYGHTGFVTNNGAYQTDVITLSGPSGSVQMNVVCTGGGGWQYESFGTTSKAFDDSLAEAWCGNWQG